MDLPDRHVLLGMTLGALCATTLAFTGPGMVIETFADDVAERLVPRGFDPSELVHFEDKSYKVESEEWVATEPLSTTRIKKIEAGLVSYVTITTTESGTYSTDAMFSDHVQYPGIAVSEVPQPPQSRLSYLSGGSWHGLTGDGANSFFYFRSGDTRIRSWRGVTCVSGANYAVC